MLKEINTAAQGSLDSLAALSTQYQTKSAFADIIKGVRCDLHSVPLPTTYMDPRISPRKDEIETIHRSLTALNTSLEHDVLRYHRNSVTLTSMWPDLWIWAEPFFQTHFVTVAGDDDALYAELLDVLTPTAMAVMDSIGTLLYAPRMRSRVFRHVNLFLHDANLGSHIFQCPELPFRAPSFQDDERGARQVLESVEQQTKISSTLHLVPPDHVKASLFTAVGTISLGPREGMGNR
ncbi:uncharacterized protein EV420DRAFT_1730195 [Desarmillaria tabescens]|uniref:Uncharacterized protein n=1 Tax=Armillaria tabescens TaxID=1929756 RepID=A0AA39MNG3_ARMTA|nr:uncharacterized protein EV420DRAFT_1730195 [Desarmillaria tabescens]KAK0441226.1 hypothetical protein EV420DRAFT_1730195 [Desarmillaria tabescens]